MLQLEKIKGSSKMERRTKREYTMEFKQQMVSLHASGKPSSEIISEYDLSTSAELTVYVYWFNNKRIHGTLGYKIPVEFR